jgi:hypothetical protein
MIKIFTPGPFPKAMGFDQIDPSLRYNDGLLIEAGMAGDISIEGVRFDNNYSLLQAV